MILKTDVYLPSLVGKGYGVFWHNTCRYRVVKGSRASKKSKTTALNLIYRLMKYPSSNLLVVRKVFRTLKDSCYSDLKWAIHKLQVDTLWECKTSPLEITYRPTGQKILFRGLDDPLKITSISVPIGALCWVWIEEAYEIMKEDDFNMLDESVRGEMPKGLFKQITLTLNPWNDRHWIKKRFFDVERSDVFTATTNYLCNEFLDESDLQLYEFMKKHNPKRYQVAGLGNWGIVDGLVFENWEEQTFHVEDVRNKPTIKKGRGLDFGYTNDPTAFWCGEYDKNERILYVSDEWYKKGANFRTTATQIKKMGYQKDLIIADSNYPETIDNIKNEGISRMRGAKKGKGSIQAGIDWLNEQRIVVHPRCVNFITEINNYTWEVDKFGDKLNVPIDDFNHLMDAMRYGIEPIRLPSGVEFLR